MRAIAILSVFVHHALGIPLLWIGVDLFFVLSGFLITGILLNRKEKESSYFGYFYARRARRILAPYLLLLIVSSCLFGIEWMRHWIWYVFFSTNIAAALHQVGHESLQPLWSLAVEEQFYLIWPVIVLFVPQRRLLQIAVCAILFTPILRALCTPLFQSHFPIYFLTPFRIDLLCAGALLAIVWRTRPEYFQRLRVLSYACILGAAGLLLVLSRYPQYRTSSNTAITNGLLYSINLVLVTAVLTSALAGKGAFCRLMSLPALRFIGIISYSMYLIHMTAILIARRFIPNHGEAFAAALALTVLYASLTWYIFERRLLGMRMPEWDTRSPSIPARTELYEKPMAVDG